jgi:hypothetical protein
MKTTDEATNSNAELHVGTEALHLHLKEIGWNLRTMLGQADVLETAIIEMKKQTREYSAAE